MAALPPCFGKQGVSGKVGMAALPPCCCLQEGGNGKVGMAALPPCFGEKVVMAWPSWQHYHIGMEKRWGWQGVHGCINGSRMVGMGADPPALCSIWPLFCDFIITLFLKLVMGGFLGLVAGWS